MQDRLVRAREERWSGAAPYTFSFSESTPLDNTHLLVAVVGAALWSETLTATGWSEVAGGGQSPTGYQLRVYVRRGDGTVNGLTLSGTAGGVRACVLMAFKGYTSLTPLATASNQTGNVTTATFLAIPSPPAGYGVSIASVFHITPPTQFNQWTAGYSPNVAPYPVGGSAPVLSVGRYEYTTGATTATTATWTGSTFAALHHVIMPLTPPATPPANRQIFTANGTFTPPAGVTSVNVLVVGAGGAGCANARWLGPGGGGGSGNVQWRTGVAVSGPVSVVVGVPSAQAVVSVGGQSSFDTIVAGGGGSGSSNPYYDPAGGGGSDPNTRGSGGGSISEFGTTTATSGAHNGASGKGGGGGAGTAGFTGPPGHGGTGVDMGAFVGTDVGDSGWFGGGGGGGAITAVKGQGGGGDSTHVAMSGSGGGGWGDNANLNFNPIGWGATGTVIVTWANPTIPIVKKYWSLALGATPRNAIRGAGALLTSQLGAEPPIHAFPAAVLADAPILYWRLGEASGTVAADSSGQNRPGTYTNGLRGAASLVTGDTNTAATFLGGNSYVARAWESWMSTNTFTVECIAQPTATGTQATINTDGQTRGWWIRLVSGGAWSIVDGVAGAAIWTSAAGLWTTNTRYHMALVTGASGTRFYINGVLLTPAVNRILTPTGGNQMFTVGGSGAGVSPNPAFDMFTGVIDEVVWYPTELSAARILVHAQAAGLYVPPPPPAAADDFNRANGALGSTSVGAKPWVVADGAGWAIASNRAAWSGTAIGQMVVSSGLTDNYDVQFTVPTISAGASPWSVVVRGTTASSFMAIYRNRTSSQWVLSNEAGASPLTANHATDVAAGDVVRVRVVGTAITVFLNGTQVAAFTSSLHLNGPYQGIRGWASTAVTIDDFSVTPI